MDGADKLCVTKGADMEMEYFPTWTTKKVPFCPRDIRWYLNNPHHCKELCRDFRGLGQDGYEEEHVLRMLVVEKQTVIDSRACSSQ